MTEDENYSLEEESFPTPEMVKAEIPLSKQALETIANGRKDIENILSNKDSRLLLIIGPCSIHDEESALEFAAKLNILRKEVADQFVIAMRVYFEKPRTLLGWKGMLYDPHLDGSHDIIQGIRNTRSILMKVAEMGIPTAAEILNSFSACYLQDLLSWGCIGARTAESQVHREIASSMPMPVAFKNNTDGNMQIAVHGALAARAPHTFLSIADNGKIAKKKSKGNDFSHIVLRGGNTSPNYFPGSVENALKLLEEAGLNNGLIIDCSHGNTNRHPLGQIAVFESVLTQVKEGTKQIKGLILESHLNEGRQDLQSPFANLKYGVSLTDSCLEYNATESLILKGYHFLKSNTEVQENSWNECETGCVEKNLVFN